MSYPVQQADFLEGQWEEFNELLSQRNFKGAGAVLDRVGDLGYEAVAVRMYHEFNRTKMRTLEGQLEAIGKLEYARTPAENNYWAGIRRAQKMGILARTKLV